MAWLRLFRSARGLHSSLVVPTRNATEKIMLLQTLLAAHLIFSAGSSAISASPQDELPALPTAWSEEKSARFVSLVSPSPNVQTSAPTLPPVNPPCTRLQGKLAANPPSPAQAAALKLRSQLSSHNGNIVILTLQSHRTIKGKYVTADQETFSLRVNNRSKPVKIRYSEVVGPAKFRTSANQIIGRTILAAGVIVAIPAIPFIFFGGLISGDLSD
jgi:hypothetical protein